MRREDIAWAAGLFEGEGWALSKGRAQIGLEMTDEECVRRFSEVVGVGRFSPTSRPRYRPDGSAKKPLWSWRATSYEDIQAFVAMVWPWLSSRRRAQVEATLLLRQKTWTCRYARPPRGTDFVHGTLSSYTNKKCRCDECRLANRAYKQHRRLVQSELRSGTELQGSTGGGDTEVA